MAGHRKIVSAGDAIDALIRAATSEVAGVPTGFSLDQRYIMPRLGNLGLVVARSSVGKSTFYLNVIARTPEVPTVVCNIEMTSEEQIEILACMSHQLRVPVSEVRAVIRAGAADFRYPSTMEALQDVGRYFPNLRLITFEGQPTVNDLIEAVDDVEDEMGMPVQRVIIDHVSLISGAQDYSGMKSTCGALKQWAKGSHLFVLALQQGTRSGDASGRNNGHIPPELGSGEYGGEQDADICYGLYQLSKHPKYAKPENRDSEYERIVNTTHFSIFKNRFGRTNVIGVPLRFDEHSYRYFEEKVGIVIPEYDDQPDGANEPF